MNVNVLFRLDGWVFTNVVQQGGFQKLYIYVDGVVVIFGRVVFVPTPTLGTS